MTLESLLDRYRTRLRAATFRLLNENFDQKISVSQLHDYHLGYEEQMKKWPAVPVLILIKYITGQDKMENDSDDSHFQMNLQANQKKRRKYQDKKSNNPIHKYFPLNIDSSTKIADMGCGTCKLAEGVTQFYIEEYKISQKIRNISRFKKEKEYDDQDNENVRESERSLLEIDRTENKHGSKTQKGRNQKKSTNENTIKDFSFNDSEFQSKEKNLKNSKHKFKKGPSYLSQCPDISAKSENCPQIIEKAPVFYNYDLYPVNNSIIKAPSNNIPTNSAFFDIVVFCLSLMSKNISSEIQEASRILKPNGHLLIAELSSRISTHLLISQLESYNFKLNTIIFQNDFFFIIDMVKMDEDNQMKHPMDIILKPAVYKKR